MQLGTVESELLAGWSFVHQRRLVQGHTDVYKKTLDVLLLLLLLLLLLPLLLLHRLSAPLLLLQTVQTSPRGAAKCIRQALQRALKVHQLARPRPSASVQEGGG